MNKIIILILLLLISSFVFAECETSVENIKRFDATYHILENGSSEASFVVVAHFPERCLIERYKFDLNLDEHEEITIQIPYQDFVCPKEFILNNVGTEFGNFPEGLDCSASFTTDRNTIRMDYRGTSSFLGKIENDKVIVSLGNSPFTINLTRDSSLTIFIPSTTTYLNHFPRNASMSANRLYFAPFPKEEVYFEYFNINANQAETISLLPIILIGVGVLAIIIFLFGLIAIVKPKEKEVITKVVEKKDEVNSDEKLLNDAKKLKEKMKSLEQAYLKGSVDQTTYRRLMEQYQYQLNDIRVELKQKNN